MLLYTPGTGFPDLEAKIAFGLARVALEVIRPESIILRPRHGFYTLEGDANEESLEMAFRTLAERFFSAEAPFNLPGIQGKYRNLYRSVDDNGYLKSVFEERSFTATYGDWQPGGRRDFRRDNLCGHEVEAFGGSKGLVLGASVHAGKPYKRDSGGKKDNTRLCAFCGSLAVLGTAWAAYRGFMGTPGSNINVMVVPLPNRTVEGPVFQQIFAAQKEARGRSLGSQLPIQLVPLAYLARFPEVADLLSEVDGNLHVSAFVSAGPGRERLSGETLLDVSGLVRFLRTTGAFGVATALRLLQQRNPDIDALRSLDQALRVTAEKQAGQAAMRFGRSYHAQQGIGLYPDVGDYLVEVIGVKLDPEARRHLDGYVSILRYFAGQRNYWYVDAVRNARSKRVLEEILAKASRQAHAEWNESQRREEQGRKSDEPSWRRPPFPPSPDDLEELLERVASDEEREEVQRYLVMAALTIPRRRGVQGVEVDMEVAEGESAGQDESQDKEDA